MNRCAISTISHAVQVEMWNCTWTSSVAKQLLCPKQTRSADIVGGGKLRIYIFLNGRRLATILRGDMELERCLDD